MKRFIGRLGWRFALSTVATLAVAGGVAYAAIPDSPASPVYHACMLKNIGTIRLIDPSLPTSSFMQHCTSLEAAITFDQKGAKGDPGGQGLPGNPGSPGTPGAASTVPGPPGQPGQSVTEANAGPPDCANGGVALTAANGTGFVCNGKDGTNGTNGQNGTGLSKLGDLNGLPCNDQNGAASSVKVRVNPDGSVTLSCPAKPALTTDEVTLTPPSFSMDFPGAGSLTHTFTLTNTGSNVVSIDSIVGSTSTTCTGSLAAGGGFCTITATAVTPRCDSAEKDIEVTGVDSVTGAAYDVTAQLFANGGTGGQICQ